MARNAIVLGVAVALCSLVGGVEAQTSSSDPIIGAWTLNVARSVWSPGPRAPADLVLRREYATLESGWRRFTQSGPTAQGAPAFQIGVFRLDEQRHPVHSIATLGALMTAGRASNLTRSYRVIDARTVESTTYTDGVAGIPVVRAVQPDGMTFIETTRGTNAQGVAIHNVLVWERVR